jgi:Thioredoxin like C-terminal domain
VTEPRLYQLVRQTGAVSERTFEIMFLDPGVHAYGFTFGVAQAMAQLAQPRRERSHQANDDQHPGDPDEPTPQIAIIDPGRERIRLDLARVDRRACPILIRGPP